MSKVLSGKVALVTGGSRGIGLAIARALVADGVQVSVTGKSDAHLSAARIRHAKLVEFPDLGHSPQIQDPAAFHKALLDGLIKP